MKNNEKVWLWGIVGFLGGIVITVLVTSNAVNTQNQGMMQMMGIGNQYRMGNNVDKHFIEQMIPHHEDAIEMANLAKEKSTNKEILTLSDNIITSQSSEIELMKTWYKDWYSYDVPEDENDGMGIKSGMMHEGVMEDDTDFDTLKNAVDFDKAFIEEMIPHHQMAVVMAKMLEQASTRSEMKKLARDIITAQTKEIEMMQEWQKAWGY